MEQRLAFIEFRLFWEGCINRGEITARFGVSAPQASADLARYEAIAPGNLVYDSTAKTYVPGAGFAPKLRSPTADDYLLAVQTFLSGAVTEDEIWPGSASEFDAVPAIRRQIPVGTLRSLVRAIRERSSIRVRYQSFSQPESGWRWLAPHAIAFDGLRWHARSWCSTHGDFRDFVLARILHVGEAEPSDVDPTWDEEWQRRVTLRIAPNPALPREQRTAIEFDFGMSAGELAVPMRVCHAYYFERLHGLDTDPTTVDPKRQQVVLLNRHEVDLARMDARAAAMSALAGQRIVSHGARPDPASEPGRR